MSERFARIDAEGFAPDASEPSRMLINPRATESERARVQTALSHLESPASRGHIWVSTSGSTAAPGASKWVALSKAALLASASAVNLHLRSSDSSGDVWMHVLPEFHVGGIGIFARASLVSARVCDGLAGDRWNANEFHARCLREGATLSALVSAQVHDLVQADLRSPPSLRAIVIGGGALAPSLYKRARELGWAVLPSYGLSENASQVATAALDTVQAGEASDAAMPEPELLSHVEVKTGDDQRLSLRSPALFSGYGMVEGDRATWLDPKQDGWFRSEDRIELHTTGSRTTLKVLGRTADFLKIGGESVDLARLELLLARSVGELAVERMQIECALVPIPDSRLGQVICLAVHAPAADDAALAHRMFQRFNEKVLPFERARSLAFLSEPFPRSPLGKILRAKLVDLVNGTGV